VLWTVPLSKGWSVPVVHGGEVFIVDRLPRGLTAPLPPSAESGYGSNSGTAVAEDEALRCLDLATGKEKWRFAWDANNSAREGAIVSSRSVPAVDVNNVYVLGSTGPLHCISRSTHKPAWSGHLIKDFPGCAKSMDDVPDATYRNSFLLGKGAHRRYAAVPKWGFTQCPLLYKGTVIVAPQTEMVGVAAYEIAGGTIRWRSPFIGRAWFTHISPQLVRLGGVDQAVLLANLSLASQPAAVSGVDAATGKLLWYTHTTRKFNIPIPMPVQIAEDRLFVSGGYRYGCGILSVARRGEQWSAEWTLRDSNDCTPHIHTPVVYGGHIYAQSFDKFHNKDGSNGLVCMNLDGKLRWRSGPERVFDSGSVIAGDGLLFVLHGETGELSLVEASAERMKVLATAKVLAAVGGQAWAPMALAGGRLLVRDLHEMKCLDVRAAAK
jgi:outer membrane protein assembly factor BamB